LSRVRYSFSLLYGIFHAYFYLSVCASFDISTTGRIYLAIAMFVLVLAPFYARKCGNSSFGLWTRAVYWSTYTWMGFVFLFTVTGLAYDFVSWFPGTAEAFQRPADIYQSLPENQFFIVLAISCLLTAYSIGEASSIQTRKIRVESPRIPIEKPPFRIGQISDVHLGILGRRKRSRKIAEIIKREKPDVLVSTGDLVDARTDQVLEEAAIFSEINPPLGKYAIRGNHEFYHEGGTGFDRFCKEAGFVPLKGKTAILGNGFRVTGIDDEVCAFWGVCSPGEGDLLRRVDGDGYSILLKHKPDLDPDSLDRYDLQLSGHTHGGQIFPFFLATRTKYPHYTGMYRPTGASRTLLYVSPGTGTWGPPMRLFAPPEVTIIEVCGTKRPAAPAN